MADNLSQRGFSHLQDVLGNFPMLKRYILICLFFTLPEHVSISTVNDELEDGLRKLAEAFPFLAGQIILEGRTEGFTGITKIVPLENTIHLLMNDLRDNSNFPSMSEMKKANYPFSMLDPNILAPPIAVSWSREGYEKTAPVLILQANYVKGGLILTVTGNHHTMDMTGLGGIITLFSKACCKEQFTEEEIRQGNQSRREAIPLLNDDWQPGSELDDCLLPPTGVILPDSQSPPARWAYFNFKADSLARLKNEAGQQDIVPYVSTDDAVAALCWQRIAKARAPRLGNQASTTFCRPISARNHFGLKGYLGHMVDCVYENEVDVFQQPLGEVAGRLRRMLQQEYRIKHHVQAFATMLSRTPDKSVFVNGARLDPSRDVVLSSYANIKCCQLSFGPLLGEPDVARRPQMMPWPSLLYMMPKTKDGDIAVGFCVGEDDMERLQQDEVLGSYADYVG